MDGWMDVFMYVRIYSGFQYWRESTGIMELNFMSNISCVIVVFCFVLFVGEMDIAMYCDYQTDFGHSQCSSCQAGSVSKFHYLKMMEEGKDGGW